MSRSTRKAHPADRGLVMLTAWVAPELRDYARFAAQENGVPVSEWVSRAVRRAVLQHSIDRLEWNGKP